MIRFVRASGFLVQLDGPAPSAWARLWRRLRAEWFIWRWLR